MILRFLIRGGGIALGVLALVADLITYGMRGDIWIGATFALALSIGATVLFHRTFAFPPMARLREIADAVPDGPHHLLVNDKEKVRFLVTRSKMWMPPHVLTVARFADADINESYSDYNTGETISTIPVDAFEIFGKSMVLRTMRPLVVRFVRADGELYVHFEQPKIGEPVTRRAAFDSLAFHMRSGVGRVTDEEIEELAAQMRDAHLDPDATWDER